MYAADNAGEQPGCEPDPTAGRPTAPMERGRVLDLAERRSGASSARVSRPSPSRCRTATSGADDGGRRRASASREVRRASCFERCARGRVVVGRGGARRERLEQPRPLESAARPAPSARRRRTGRGPRCATRWRSPPRPATAAANASAAARPARSGGPGTRRSRPRSPPAASAVRAWRRRRSGSGIRS